MTLAKRNYPDKTIRGVFVTTTKLSEIAKDCAQILKIKVLMFIMIKIKLPIAYL